MTDWASLGGMNEAAPAEAVNEAAPSNVDWASMGQMEPDDAEPKPVPTGTPPIRQLVDNIPGSARKYGADMLNFILHPKTSAEAMGQLIAGFTEKLVPGEQPDEWKADAMVQFFKNRYGSMEAAKKTAVKDPVGFMADVGTVVTPIGKLVQAGRFVKTGQAIANVGASMEPISAAAAAGRKVLSGVIPKGLPQKWYKSAAKFSTKLTHQERTKLTQTALDYDIMPTIKGLNMIEDHIGSIDIKINKMIERSSKKGEKIPVEDLFSHFDELHKDAMSKELDGVGAAKEVSAVYESFLDTNAKLDRWELTPREVQSIKTTVYKRLKTAYEKNSKSPVSAEAKQAIARSAKESLEKLFPEIKELNAKDGALIELHKALQGASNRIVNRDITGIGLALKSSMGAALGGTGAAAIGAAPEVGATIGGVVGVGLGILDTPTVKSKLALVAHKLKKKGVVLNSNHALIRLGLVQLGRQTKTEKKEWKITSEYRKHLTDEDL